MAVFYNTSNGVLVSDVQVACASSDADNTRVLTICSLLKSEGDCPIHAVLGKCDRARGNVVQVGKIVCE